jgi:hypothetical protein
VESQTPPAAAINPSASSGADLCLRNVLLRAVVCRWAGTKPPIGTGSVCGDRSSEPAMLLRRLPTSLAGIGHRAIDDADRIECNVHGHAQASATRGDNPA